MFSQVRDSSDASLADTQSLLNPLVFDISGESQFKEFALLQSVKRAFGLKDSLGG